MLELRHPQRILNLGTQGPVALWNHRCAETYPRNVLRVCDDWIIAVNGKTGSDAMIRELHAATVVFLVIERDPDCAQVVTLYIEV